jgi:hypothetical protein
MCARRGHLVTMPRTVRQKGRFMYLCGKRRVLVDIREDPLLARWLDATPDSPPDKPRAGGR